MNLTPPPSLVVGVADCKVSSDTGAQIITYALGSCLGITAYDSVNRIGGLLHVMLPDSTINRVNANRPAMYVDSGLPLLLDMMAKAGALTGRLTCKIFGGAQVLSADSYFRIGEKNIRATEKLMPQLGLRVSVWEVGGQVNRTIKLSLANGEVKVRVPNKEDFIR